jgi:hypothetical protein
MYVGSNQIIGAAAAQMLTNKTLMAPESTISNTGTLTLPSATTTFVGQDTTNTLTNKTITGSTNVIDTNAIQTTSTAVNVSTRALPFDARAILISTSMTATRWSRQTIFPLHWGIIL